MPVQVAVVVSGEHETAFPHSLQQTPPGVERGEQDIAQLPRDLHEPAQLLDPHPEHRGLLHGHTREEGPGMLLMRLLHLANGSIHTLISIGSVMSAQARRPARAHRL
jgi:hypothetical protein